MARRGPSHDRVIEIHGAVEHEEPTAEAARLVVRNCRVANRAGAFEEVAEIKPAAVAGGRVPAEGAVDDRETFSSCENAAANIAGHVSADGRILDRECAGGARDAGAFACGILADQAAADRG